MRELKLRKANLKLIHKVTQCFSYLLMCNKPPPNFIVSKYQPFNLLTVTGQRFDWTQRSSSTTCRVSHAKAVGAGWESWGEPKVWCLNSGYYLSSLVFLHKASVWASPHGDLTAARESVPNEKFTGKVFIRPLFTLCLLMSHWKHVREDELKSSRLVKWYRYCRGLHDPSGGAVIPDLRV